MSDQNPFDLIQAEGIIRAVIQLGRAQRLVGRNLLSMFNCTTILEVGRNPGRSEGMAAGRLRQSSLPGAACCRCSLGRRSGPRRRCLRGPRRRSASPSCWRRWSPWGKREGRRVDIPQGSRTIQTSQSKTLDTSGAGMVQYAQNEKIG